jgi:hypothetical protein
MPGVDTILYSLCESAPAARKVSIQGHWGGLQALGDGLHHDRQVFQQGAGSLLIRCRVVF